MPLHDWTDRDNFDGLHHLWISELGRYLRRVLPTPYRVALAPAPLVGTDSDMSSPNAVLTSPPLPSESFADISREPDAEMVVPPLRKDMTVLVERNGRLVAAIELISPGNKDRPENRDRYAGRYLSYLHHGVHLLIVDVHRRPIGFSFPQLMSERLVTPLPAPPAPSAVVYRVGESMKHDGRLLAVWAEPLTVGQPLPAVSLPLTVHLAVPIDLEGTYSRAADNCYLG